jgi:hypothetical protein
VLSSSGAVPRVDGCDPVWQRAHRPRRMLRHPSDRYAPIARAKVASSRIKPPAVASVFVFPKCSFCGGQPPVAWYQGPDFQVAVDRPEDVNADEAYLACETCDRLIDADDREGLVLRGVARVRERSPANVDDEALLVFVRSKNDGGFWSRRDAGAS